MAPRSTRVAPETQVRSPGRSLLQSLDNFYSPSRDRRGEAAVQEGINAFGGILEEEARRAKTEQRTDEFNQGVQDALREQAGQELKGVKTGSIFRQNSRFYMAGLNETRGKAAASQFKNNLTLAYQEWEGRHTDDDGSSFREWMNGQVADFMGGLGEDQHKVAGALPTVREVANNFAAQHTSFTSKRLERESFEAYDEIVSGVFTDLANGTIDMDMAVTRIAAEADDMYTTDGAQANNRVVEAAIRYANIHNDPDSILALAKAHDAGSLKLSQVNREKLANAMDAVEADIARNTYKENARVDAEEKARRKAILNGFGAELEQDPYMDLPPFSEVGDYQTYQAMKNLQDAFITSNKVENPTVTNLNRMRLEAQLSDATNAAERMGVLSEFVAENPNGLSSSDVSSYMKEIIAKDDPGSIVNNTTVQKYRTGFGELLGQYQTDAYDIEQVSLLKTMGQRYFDDYLLASTGKYDLSDPASILEATNAAEEYAVKQLTRAFPNMMAEGLEGDGARAAAGSALGADTALEERQAEIASEAESIYNQLAGVEGSAEEPVTAEEPQVQPEVTPEPEPEIEVDPVLEDTEFTDDNLPVRGGVYGEMLQRFTDGSDDRHTLRSASEVMESDPAFAAEVDALGAELGVDPMALMAVMDFESGFDPSIENMAGSGATGLIQFMPRTARSLGTTTEALAQMGRAEQMRYVRAYFKQFGSRLQGGDVDDIYMAVLWPKAIGKPSSYPIFEKGTIAYTQNKGLDTNGDGTVTKYEAASKVARKFYGY